MAYNVTALDAANTTLEWASAVNDLTDDWTFKLFLVGICLLVAITIIITTGRVLSGFVAGGFVTTLTSILLLGADLVTSTEVLYSLAFLAVFTVALFFKGVE